MLKSVRPVLIDHDDSFTHNVQKWIEHNTQRPCTVIHHSELKNASRIQYLLQTYDFFIFSPGPRRPQDYPHSQHFLKQLSFKPVLGICLGMQIMCVSEGGSVKASSSPTHGQTSLLITEMPELYQISVARYHSLICQPDEKFKIVGSAYEANNKNSILLPMWIQHQTKKWIGLQFHPESFLTEKSEIIFQRLVSFYSDQDIKCKNH